MRSDRYGGAVGRVTAPAEAVGAIRIGAAAEPEVEDHASAGVELRHVGLVSPPDEEVAVRQVLRIALVDGEKRWPVDEAANEHRALATQIEPQHDHARLTPDLRRRLVVEERERPVREASCIVLPREARARAQLEVGLLPEAAVPVTEQDRYRVRAEVRHRHVEPTVGVEVPDRHRIGRGPGAGVGLRPEATVAVAE